MPKLQAGDLAYIATTGTSQGVRKQIAQRAIGIPRTLVRLRPSSENPARLMWEFDKPISITLDDGSKHEIHAAQDCVLRPLRDQPGQDEILRIAGLPVDGIAHA